MNEANECSFNFKCTFCSCSDSSFLFSHILDGLREYNYYKCKSCKGVFQNPTPTPEELSHAYDEKYYGSKDTKFIPFISLMFNYFKKRSAVLTARQVRKNGSVIDIGCGDGSFIYYLHQLGFSCTGLEIDSKALQRARKNSNSTILEGDLLNQSFQPKIFSLISLSHVFEHLHHPKESLDIIEKIIEPDGTLIMSFPNIESIQARIFKSYWFHLDTPRHLYFPNHITLVMELEKRGFYLKKWSTFDFVQGPFGILQSILNSFSSGKISLYDRLKGHFPLRIIDFLIIITLFPFCILLAWVESFFEKGGCHNYIFKKSLL